VSQEDQAAQIGKLVLRRNELTQQRAALKAKTMNWSKPLLEVLRSVTNTEAITDPGAAIEAINRLPDLGKLRETMVELESTERELQSTTDQLRPFGI
jgi:hypothetical protein